MVDSYAEKEQLRGKWWLGALCYCEIGCTNQMVKS